jgi:hypothetical protein
MSHQISLINWGDKFDDPKRAFHVFLHSTRHTYGKHKQRLRLKDVSEIQRWGPCHATTGALAPVVFSSEGHRTVKNQLAQKLMDLTSFERKNGKDHEYDLCLFHLSLYN